MSKPKKKILIVDDSELNRALLSDMLADRFETLEAENGMEAMAILHEHELEISLMLLDIVMPVMDGFEVLAMMNQNGLIKSIPVIMISAETSGSYIDRAYDLGAIDYISRPFDERTVIHRVTSNYMLSVKQKDLSEMLSEQIYEKEKDNSLMIDVLSHIVEFRNGESGLHVLHVHAITQMILERLMKKTDKYPLSGKDIRVICNASALHDIGKISIPSEILNKPGKFTPEEYEIMKTHTLEGANMLEKVPFRKNELLIKTGYEICRWHHERYDGKGYPDGLKGDEIPISAQVVSIADVYDALTSERVYKKAYDADTALKMIQNGECGTFNPLLLECLNEIAPKLKSELGVISFGSSAESGIHDTVKQVLKSGGSDVSNRSIRLLERERMKYKFLSDISREIIFEYIAVPEMIELSEWGAESLGMPVKIMNPSDNKVWNEMVSKEDFADFVKKINKTTAENPVVICKYLLNVNGQKKWNKVIAKALWGGDSESPELEGAVGKILDVDDETAAMEYLEQKADHDSRTGLLNHNAAKKRISQILEDAKGKRYALVMFDVDDFKKANDIYGHLFGDEVLETVANRIKENIRSTDIAARMGGDEFIIFMEYKDTAEPQIKRIFERLTQKYKDFNVGVSMGVACVENYGGDYDELFNRADAAMYTVKRRGKNSFCFYDKSMEKCLGQTR